MPNERFHVPALQVVDEGAGKNEGADELLSAFNVATFKSAEDDKAFWNRLIPVDAQTKDEKKHVSTFGQHPRTK